MDKIKIVLELCSLGVFSVWAAWTEYRMRKVSAQNQEMALALQEQKNKDINHSLSDDALKSKLDKDLGSGS